MRNELVTTLGQGQEIKQPTCTVIDNNVSAPRIALSKGSGNAVIAAGSPTTLTLSAGIKRDVSVGDEIFCYGFTTAGNNGRFTVTAVADNVISFTNASAGNETLALTAIGNVSLYYTPDKAYQDVAFTSGIPNTTTIAHSSSGTCSAIAGVYSYLSASNGTDANLEIVVAGGKLTVPSGSSIGHEIRPFTSDVTCDTSGATSGSIIINIS